MMQHLSLTLEVRRLLRTKQERDGVSSLHQIIACVAFILFFIKSVVSLIRKEVFIRMVVDLVCIDYRNGRMLINHNCE